MTGFQKSCVAAIDRALGPAGLRPTYRIRSLQAIECGAAERSLACVHADFHLVQDAYEVFIYLDEVAVCSRGQRHVLRLSDFDRVAAELLRSLGEFVGRCVSGEARFAAPREARRRRRGLAGSSIESTPPSSPGGSR